ncbi:POT family domain-containing protein [Ditylenchus destructor]|uniref:POT family domain-containing protein n=1 Tax=Ditylenchus destructor TaxID=166010 RepID=A0AAD4MWN3_9BILA|nr:POT family domain-containing protein [Ditylenchus destructor]
MDSRGGRPIPPMSTTFSEMVRRWPYSTLLIIASDFVFMFSSIGALLVLYLLNVLKFSENHATMFYNGFSIVNQIAPIFGAIFADGYWGKYRTIMYCSIVYCVGKVIFVGLSSMDYWSPFHPWLDIIALLIIYMGNAGVSPCVRPFAADQFPVHEEQMLSIFFSASYAMNNVGYLIAGLVLPIVRAQPCFGHDTCYPLSFGISAILVSLSLAVFVVGSKWYKKTPPTEGNVFKDVYDIVKNSLKNRSKSSKKVQSHWLDYYFVSHNCEADSKCLHLQRQKRIKSVCHKRQFVDDVKTLFRVMLMFFPVPVYVALYDQQYTTWLIQAIQMDCRIFNGRILLIPEQMQIFNPILIIFLIPILESCIYPFIRRFTAVTLLRKMVTGLFVTAFSFFIFALVQMRINPTLPELPQASKAFVSVMNTFDNCDINVTVIDADGNFMTAMVARNSSLISNKLINRTELFDVKAGHIALSVDYVSPECQSPPIPQNISYEVESEEIHYIYVGNMGTFIAKADPKKPTTGTGQFSVSVVLALSDETFTGKVALCRKSAQESEKTVCDPGRPKDYYLLDTVKEKGEEEEAISLVNYTSSEKREQKATLYAHKHARSGNWELFYVNPTIGKQVESGNQSTGSTNFVPAGIDFRIEAQGGVYVILITGTMNQPEKRVFQVVPDNSISILWQIPQIVIMAIAEILFATSIYEFAYTEVGKSMKCVSQALRTLIASLGDVIIVCVAIFDIQDMARQAMIYVVLMIFVAVVYIFLSVSCYEYRDPMLDALDEDETTYARKASACIPSNEHRADYLAAREMRHKKSIYNRRASAHIPNDRREKSSMEAKDLAQRRTISVDVSNSKNGHLHFMDTQF